MASPVSLFGSPKRSSLSPIGLGQDPGSAKAPRCPNIPVPLLDLGQPDPRGLSGRATLPTPDLFLPDLSAFGPQPVHPHLKAARDKRDGIPALREAPKAPFKSIRPGPEAQRFYDRIKLEQSQIDEARQLKREGRFVPFEIDFGGGSKVTVTDISAASIGEGEYSKAYLCKVEGKGTCVLKLFYGKALNSAPRFVANQWMLYARNKKDPVLSQFTPEFYNFNPHLGRANELFSIIDSDERSEAAQRYVKDQCLSSIRLMPYIPQDFPIDTFDRTSSVWQQLKELFSADNRNDGYVNDLLLNNIKLGQDGHLYLIDLMEEEGDASEPMKTKEKRASSFTDQQHEINWLIRKEE